MRKTGLMIFVSLLVLVACAIVPLVPNNWRCARTITLKEGVIEKLFVLPQEGEVAVFYVKDVPVYKQWQEGERILAAVKIGNRWKEGKPLPDYSLFDGNKVVFCLLIEEKPQKFEFLIQ